MRFSSVVALTAVAALSLTACGSAKSTKSTAANTQAAAQGTPIKVGVLTSLTGPYSSGFTTVEKAVKARLGLVNDAGGINGHKITYVMADDTGSPTGAKAAVQKLIQQDKVFGIIDASPVFYGAAAAVKAAAIPVSGVSFDGCECWQDKSYSTIFDATGYSDLHTVSTTMGAFFKSQGATKVAAIANQGPSSAASAKAAIASAKVAGLQAGFFTDKLAAGTTDVGPLIQQIKASGSDAIYLPTIPTSAFAIAAGLKQAGVKMKAILLATGYGGDILGNAQVLTLADGVDFTSTYTPVEEGTAATKAFQAALTKYAGEPADIIPGFGEYVGWAVTDLFVYGLTTAGGDSSQAAFVSKLRATSDWNTGGTASQADQLRRSGQDPAGSRLAELQQHRQVERQEVRSDRGGLADLWHGRQWRDGLSHTSGT